MFKTGDILVCEFGYNCHLVNFYEVVGVTNLVNLFVLET